MNDTVAEWLGELGKPCGSKPVPVERFEQDGDMLPPFLLQLWREYGFAGFGRGRVWLVDPVEWAPIVDSWLDGITLAMGEDQWHAVTRNAFGALDLWGERTGMSLHIDPVYGWLMPSAKSATRMATEQQRNIQVFVAVDSGREFGDLTTPDGDEMFSRALKAHGQVGPDTIDGFVPALSLGGLATVDHIEIVDALAHVELLTDVGERQILGDITMSI